MAKATGSPVVESRREILGRIRRALLAKVGFEGLQSSGVATPGAPGTPEPRFAKGGSGPADRLMEVLLDYKATVSVTEPARLSRVLAEVVEHQGIKSVVIPQGLNQDWCRKIKGVDIITDDGKLSIAELSTIDGVITGCSCAIAETGTLVLSGLADEGRRAITLLPDFHFCVVRSSAIIRSVGELFTRVEVSRPVTLISGPSATSDIELRRVEGVHGPRNLFVVIVS
ncbi:MAG: LUD domain-containing protein [Actinomycetota bacterium]|nr:LUD domain-containing protein [Actinomycetota bacterium]